LVNVFNGKKREIHDVSTLVYSAPRIASDDLAREARARGMPFKLIGDAYAPRTMLAAIHEAHSVSMSI
jgi:hypothetical protein